MTIEEKIRAKKEEIKRVNRELSKLQDEARAKNEPMKIDVVCVSVSRDSQYVSLSCGGEPLFNNNYQVVAKVKCNKYPNPEKIRVAIESLSEKNDEPKSYVDWSKIDKRYNWVATDSDGEVWGYADKPFTRGSMWGYVGTHESFGLLYSGRKSKSWDKSLIHRPGIKE